MHFWQKAPGVNGLEKDIIKKASVIINPLLSWHLSCIVMFIQWLWDLFRGLISYNRPPFFWLTRFLVFKIEIYS